jgi:hypothetical protein
MPAMGLPVCVRGGLTIGPVDQDVQARVITRAGEPFGVWFDDTTPDLESVWLPKGLAKYVPLGQQVLVCVPPGRPHHHYPTPIISVYEAYIHGMGCPAADWLPLPRFDAYCVQKNWPGTHGKHPPTDAQYARLLTLVKRNDPQIIFTF